MLAEYDENGSLTTFYTRGEELISQERDSEKHYYLYDGFDSVRMLTDEDGSVTDTYTFDAFGNLTASTGDTENDFLYRGEQFDSFTGLYYLRARYMNPSTGTFITMDEYVGSNFEPVSLHKYLYANANPVMFNDPSGYSTEGTLTGKLTAIAVIGILSVTILPNYSKFVNAIGFLLTEISDAFTFAADTIAEWVDGLLNGSKTSAEIADNVKKETEENAKKGILSDIKKSKPRPKRRVYQLAYISSQGCLIRDYRKFTFWDALKWLGITGAVNATANSVFKYDKGRSSDAQRELEHLGTGNWGIYTHDQSDAKALAMAFEYTKCPEFHGSGMYGHYHDSTHTFHIWYGGQLNE